MAGTATTVRQTPEARIRVCSHTGEATRGASCRTKAAQHCDSAVYNTVVYNKRWKRWVEGVAGDGEQRFAPPREVCPGFHWLFHCDVTTVGGKTTHGYNAAYLLVGGERTVMVDTGTPKYWSHIERQLDRALAGRRLDYVMPTHSEYVHTGNLPRLLEKFPEAQAVGDLRGYHLYFPEYAHRFVERRAGSSIDLGDTRLQVVQPVLIDLPDTVWAYEPQRRILFVADGLAHEHHRPEECGMTAGEMSELPDVANFAHYNDRAFYWTRFAEVGGYFRELERLLQTYPSLYLAPAHGTIITETAAILRRAEAGMRAGALP